MIALNPTDLDMPSPNALRAAVAARRFAARRGRALAVARAALAPAVLLPAALLLLGCCALLAVTGVGPASWQARLCAEGGPQPASCAAPAPGRDAARAPGWADPSR
ncbi:hypothetical protein [Lichenibacterium minor]|uniref:hypothetical protein n=1 Tax=Lichenibacterium minor TaxID=2316528 RepID=UPI001FE18964|nr:hypothetical protein [Lichenibacterium minor]